MKLPTQGIFLLFLFLGSTLSSSNLQTLQEPVRRGKKPRVGFHFAQRCTVSITAPSQEDSSESNQDVIITTKVVCNENVLYDKEQKLSALQETEIEKGIKLFTKNRVKGAAYLVVEDEITFLLSNSIFKNLPPFPGVETAAPMVVDGSRGWVSDSTFEGNKGFEMAGAVYATSIPTTRAKVEFFDSALSDNTAAHAGAVAADEHAEMSATNCTFLRNFGKQAGAISLRDFAAADLEDCTLEGVGVSEGFMRYIRGESDDLEGEEVSSTGAVRADNYARVELQECNFLNHAGTQGTVMALGETSLFMEDCNFTSNAAELGGAIYMEGRYGNTGKAYWTTFEKNSARHGGALTVFGDGVFTLYKSDFVANSAQNGGAVFSGHSFGLLANGDICEDPSQGSRISANYSKFTANSASQSGGALFSRCAQVLLQSAAFDGNDAGEHGGGIFLDTGYQLDAPSSKFTNNSAAVSGGAIFASATNLIELEDCLLHDNHAGDGGGGALLTSDVQDVHLRKANVSWNTAKGSGGALALSGGSILRVEEGAIHNNMAGQNGGAIYSESVDQTRLQLINLTENAATQGNGGGICSQSSGSIDLEDITLTSNLAWGSGGAVASIDTDVVSLSKVIASHNTAQNQDGGAFMVDNAMDVTVANAGQSTRKLKSASETSESLLLHNNNAGGKGGGMFISQSTSVSVGNIKVVNNTGMAGGAFAAQNVQTLDIDHSRFEDNNATRGGGLSLEKSGSVTISNAHLTRNSAEEHGGAISAIDVAKLMMSDLEIEKNQAGDGAGVRLSGRTNLVGSTVTFADNEARDNGGGIACHNDCVIDMSGSVFTYNYAPDAGSISAACNCNVTAVKCAFVRDQKRNDNGDFFESDRRCSWIEAKGCSFVGGPWRLSLFWLITIICSASVLIGIGAGFMRYCVAAAVKRKNEPDEMALLSDRMSSSSSSSSSSGSYSSSYGDDEREVVIDVASEDQAGATSSHPRALVGAKSVAGLESGLDDPAVVVKPNIQVLPDGSGVSLALVTSPEDNI